MASSAYPNLLNNEAAGVDPRLHPQSYGPHNGEVAEVGRQNEPRRTSTQQFDEYESDSDGQGGDGKKRKRPMSVSCELCKQRKVKCDRGQPNCGWCLRNSQVCEYRERKKPGLRAGYGRELEARLGKSYSLVSPCRLRPPLLSPQIPSTAWARDLKVVSYIRIFRSGKA